MLGMMGWLAVPLITPISAAAMGQVNADQQVQPLSNPPATAKVMPVFKSPLYEMVVDISLTSDGKASRCQVVENSNPTVDPCDSFSMGDQLAIPFKPTDEPIGGTIRITMSAVHRVD